MTAKTPEAIENHKRIDRRIYQHGGGNMNETITGGLLEPVRALSAALDIAIAERDTWRAKAMSMVEQLDQAVKQVAALQAALATVTIERDYRPRMDDYEALQARIATLEAAQRWIPCSESMPEPGHLVLAATKHIWMACVNSDGDWFNTRADRICVPVTHWRPMPAPPEAE